MATSAVAFARAIATEPASVAETPARCMGTFSLRDKRFDGAAQNAQAAVQLG
jgi:hypothetical protein